MAKRTLLFIALCWVVLSTPVRSQWTNIAPAILSSAFEFDGVGCFRDGIVWMGSKSLVRSADSGKTWTPISFAGSANPRDIEFFDKQNGLIGTESGAYVTRDGGNTWTHVIGTSQCPKVAFNGSPNVFHVLQYSPNIFFTTTDGGATFTSSQNFFGTGSSFAIGKDGSIWRLTFIRDKSWLNKSTDLGRTFGPDLLNPDPDCWSVLADSCDPQRLYLMNEDWAWTLDGLSEIFVSTDGGVSWTNTASHSAKFFSGALVSTANSIFATTVSNNGLFRSTDRGVSWKDIKGPSIVRDGRSIAVANDNIIFVLDPGGSIWRTINGGGDSATVFPIGSPITPHVLFASDSLDCLGTITKNIGLKNSYCASSSVLGYRLEGVNASSYLLDSSSPDTLGVTFKPGTITGAHNGRIIFSLDNGTFDTVQLRGFNDAKLFTFSTKPTALFVSDTIYQCDAGPNDTIALTLNGCPPNIVSQTITGSGAGDYRIVRTARSPIAFGTDSVIISFNPIALGLRQAIFELVFDNGQKLTVSLAGFCATTKPLAITSLNQSTDTVGGTVHIPITVVGLDKQQDVELVLHYDNTPDLKYEGSFSTAATPLDVPGTIWQGRSKLSIKGATNNVILGYADFTVYADSLATPKVWFDSLLVLTAVSPCEYSFQATAISIVAPPFGCGTSILSKFLRRGTIADVFIYPNPTTGSLSLESSMDIDDARIEVYDCLGVLKVQDSRTLKKATEELLDLTALSSGMYLLRVSSTTGAITQAIVVQK